MPELDEKVPIGLYTLQKWFGNVISSRITGWDDLGIPIIEEKKTIQEAEKLITANRYLRSDQRIGIYKMQYWLRLFDLMKDDFPFVLRLFSDKAFIEKIVTPYLLDHQPCSWSLIDLGEKLPQWIEKNHPETPDKKLIYWAAILDFAYCRIFYAPHHRPIKNTDPTKKIYLQSFVEVFTLEADLFSFREEFLKQDANYWMDHPFPKLKKNKTFYFVLYLDGQKVRFNEITKGEYVLLQAFQKGASLEEAMETFPKELVDNADIELWFQIWAENEWLTKNKV